MGPKQELPLQVVLAVFRVMTTKGTFHMLQSSEIGAWLFDAGFFLTRASKQLENNLFEQ